LWSPDGGAGLFARLGEHAYPAGGYFSVKKSNQKSLGEDPETPYASVRPDRKVCDLPDLGLDDAYKVFILIRFLLAAGSKIKCAAGTLRAYPAAA